MRDARGAERVRVSLRARLMIDGAELEADVLDVSVTGLALSCLTRPRMGADAIVYVDGLSRFEGRVARYFKGGFAIAYALPEAKRGRITQKLMSLVAGKDVAGKDVAGDPAPVRDPQPRATEWTPSEHRNQNRIPHQNPEHRPGRGAAVRLEDGTPIPADVLDASVVGITLRTKARPPIGTRLFVRGAAVKVARHTMDGVMVEFDRYWEGVSRWGSWTSGEVAKR